MLDLTLSFIISLEEQKCKYMTNASTGQSLTKNRAIVQEYPKNLALSPLDQGGQDTLGYETDLWVGVVSEGFMEEQGLELAFEEQTNG